MRVIGVLAAVSAVAAFAACTTSDRAASDSAAMTDTGAMTADTGMANVATSDPDINVAGGGLPAGFMARTDRADAPISGAKYARSGDAWEVTTGPAHILYSPTTVGNGSYSASATIEQLEAPKHPEAYGIFIGGRTSTDPARRTRISWYAPTATCSSRRVRVTGRAT